MEPFTRLSGIAAPLPLINVDTDMIIPKQFLKTIRRTGLGTSLFFDHRYLDNGTEHPEFVLNHPVYREAVILITGHNFGCGSSREHAPWSLLDFGIRCIIAPSFADIFHNNCFKNGILPIVLHEQEVERLMEEASTAANPTKTIDLPAQMITSATGRQVPFHVDPFRKRCLMEGLDDVGLTFEQEHAIDRFEADQRSQQPWLYAQ